MHFDHSYKCGLYTISGPVFEGAFAPGVKKPDRQGLVTCKGQCFELVEEKGLSDRVFLSVSYFDVRI